MPAAPNPVYPLVPHPVSERGAVRELRVSVHGIGDARLSLRYQLEAELAGVLIPEPAPPRHTDALWRHTCFEAFVGRANGEYREYNFSPSGAWAAYHFRGYREGMVPLAASQSPSLRWRGGEDLLELDVTLDLSGLWQSAERRLRLGLAAVIEDRTRVLSYWALSHPLAKPDFHHDGGFVLDLDRPATIKLGE